MVGNLSWNDVDWDKMFREADWVWLETHRTEFLALADKIRVRGERVAIVSVADSQGTEPGDLTSRRQSASSPVCSAEDFLRKLVSDAQLLDYGAVLVHVPAPHSRPAEMDLCLVALRRVVPLRRSNARPLRVLSVGSSLKSLAAAFAKDPSLREQSYELPSIPRAPSAPSAGVREYYLNEAAENVVLAAAQSIRTLVAQRMAVRAHVTVILPARAHVRVFEWALESEPGIAVYSERSSVPSVASQRRMVVAVPAIEEEAALRWLESRPDFEIVVDCGYAAAMRAGIAGFDQEVIFASSRRCAEARRAAAREFILRLYPESCVSKLPVDELPGIQREGLDNVLLRVAALGCDSVLARVPWPHPPPRRLLTMALQHLRAWRLVDVHGRLTKDGEVAARLPLPASLAALVVAAPRFGCVSAAIDAAAILAQGWRVLYPLRSAADGRRRRERDRMAHSISPSSGRWGKKGGANSGGSQDSGEVWNAVQMLRVYAALELRRQNAAAWNPQEQGVSRWVMQRALECRQRVQECVSALLPAAAAAPLSSSVEEAHALRRCLTSVFAANAARLVSGTTYASLAQAGEWRLHPRSPLAVQPPPYIVFAWLDPTYGDNVMSGAVAVLPHWLPELAPHIFVDR